MSLPLAAENRRPVLLLLLLAAVATALKAVWAFYSVGTYDARMFYLFAAELQTQSLEQLYHARLDFNHTPLLATGIRELYALTQGDYRVFSGVFRAFSILADLAVILTLIELQPKLRLPRWALVAFIFSPVSIVLSGFHGNVDPILAAFLFLAAIAAWHARPAAAGALLALAANIKIVPLLLIPAFVCYLAARDRRATIAFLATLAAGLLLGYGPMLATEPRALLTNVFSYGGYWGSWGLPYWLSLSGWKDLQVVAFTNLPKAEVAVMLFLKLVTVAGVCALAWRRRAEDGRGLITTLAASFALIYVFAPGGAAQYMAWFGPFLLLAGRRWWLACTLAACAFLYAFYSASAHGPFPWFMVFPKTGEESLWIPWTIVPWFAFVALLATRLPAWVYWSRPSPAVPQL